MAEFLKRSPVGGNTLLHCTPRVNGTKSLIEGRKVYEPGTKVMVDQG